MILNLAFFHSPFGCALHPQLAPLPATPIDPGSVRLVRIDADWLSSNTRVLYVSYRRETSPSAVADSVYNLTDYNGAVSLRTPRAVHSATPMLCGTCHSVDDLSPLMVVSGLGAITTASKTAQLPTARVAPSSHMHEYPSS